MNAATESDMPLARRMVQDWLAVNNRKPIWLAQQAGVSRSVVSRFLAGKPLDAGTALKVYAVVQLGMAIEQKLDLLRALGLLSLAMIVHNSLIPEASTVQAPQPDGGNTAGTRLFGQARDMAIRSWAKGLKLYRQTERTFGPNTVGASSAGIETIQMLINLGDFSQAESEYTRVSTLYEHLFDAHAMLTMSHLNGWLHFGRRDMDAAQTAYLSTLQLAEEYRLPSEVHGARHFLGMIYTRQGKRARLSDQAARWFALADDSLRHAHDYSSRHHNPYLTGFDIFRQAQLYTAMGRYLDADDARRRARDILQGDATAQCHLGIEETDLQLRDGNTHVSLNPAQAGLSVYAGLGYAQGLARSARILMIASLQEGKTNEALRNGIAAVLFNPYVTLDDSAMLRDLVIDINLQIGREMDASQHNLLLHYIRDDAIERRGLFAHLDAIAINRDDVMNQLFSDLGLEPGESRRGAEEKRRKGENRNHSF